jgi:cytochrome c oxidase subunit 2
MTRLLPLAASEHAADFDGVLSAVHLLMGIQAVAWGAFFILCLVRFRRRAHPLASRSEIRPALAALAIGAVMVGDAVLLATSALPAWLKHASGPSSSSAPLDVRVVAEQFAWNVHYPGPDGRFGVTRPALISASNPLGIDRSTEEGRDDIGLQNNLTVPVGRPIVVQLSSRDVAHSFTLNEMRVRQDATPGLVVRTCSHQRLLDGGKSAVRSSAAWATTACAGPFRSFRRMNGSTGNDERCHSLRQLDSKAFKNLVSVQLPIMRSHAATNLEHQLLQRQRALALPKVGTVSHNHVLKAFLAFRQQRNTAGARLNRRKPSNDDDVLRLEDVGDLLGAGGGCAEVHNRQERRETLKQTRHAILS